MARLIFLGTSNAISDEYHENTHMILVGKNHAVLIDCPNNPLIRIQKAGVDFNLLSDLILTHFHPDHVSGVPQLLMNMWLMGRRAPLRVHGLAYTLDRIDKLMELYNSSEWPNFFKLEFHRLPEKALEPVLAFEDINILASPVQHFVPTIGLRMIFEGLESKSKKSLAYSCDTEPCQAVIDLAANADILVHEATGESPGHSSAAQAGIAARKAEVSSLYLIHYPTGQFATGNPIEQAQQEFDGEITIVQDYMVLDY